MDILLCISSRNEATVELVLSRCQLEYISLNKMSSMKLLSLLTVAIVLLGITTQVFACNYERMSHSPNYEKIATPKENPQYSQCSRYLRRSQWQLCSHNAKKIRIYYNCGKLMKIIDLSKHGLQTGSDCAFTDRSLYVADYHGRKVYE